MAVEQKEIDLLQRVSNLESEFNRLNLIISEQKTMTDIVHNIALTAQDQTKELRKQSKQISDLNDEVAKIRKKRLRSVFMITILFTVLVSSLTTLLIYTNFK